MPYRIAKPVLESCRAEQLVVLEEASPHLRDSTDGAWRAAWRAAQRGGLG